MLQAFENNDNEYLAWMISNPKAYVLNTERRDNTNYFVLHRSQCPHIATTNGLTHGAYTEREYVKICADYVKEIEGWLRLDKPNFTTITKECKTCNPSTPKLYQSNSRNTINFENIALGGKYDRDILASMWGYGGRQAISRGVVTPADSNIIVLFVTKKKQATYTQYNDYISNGYLYWEGEEKGANNKRIIESTQNGNAVHLFFRDKHHTDFTYHGIIELESYIEHGSSPMEAVFRILGDDQKTVDDVNEIRENLTELQLPNSDRETVRKAIKSSRIGQGAYRVNLIKLWQSCSVTGVDLLEVLTASHIKPWNKSSNMEKLDPYNGFLLSPTLDSLFDKGYISFMNDGLVVLSKVLSDQTRSMLGITPQIRLRKVYEQNIPYLKYHRENVFLG